MNVLSTCLSCSPTDFNSLLTTLRSLGGEESGEVEGREEGTGLRLLEQMLQSSTFKKAQKVYILLTGCV